MKTLTSREYEVLNEVLKAKKRVQIATELKISINTLDKHLNHIHKKTNTKSAAELILLFVKGKNDAKNGN